MADTVVVDASLGAQWVIREPYQREALFLLQSWRELRMQLLAPSLFLSEINTPLLKLRRAGSITRSDAEPAIVTVLGRVSIVADTGTLTRRAFAIADGLGLRSAHDSLYVALAEQAGAELWTADERFYNLAHPAFPLVRWIGELATPPTTCRPPVSRPPRRPIPLRLHR